MIKEHNSIIIVVGARPNYIKIAPLICQFSLQEKINVVLVHTGQHYDKVMDEHFFIDLDIPIPQINLDVGSASHAVQTARIMERFEKVCINEKPDFVFVVGDVNSTMACALTAVKLGIKIIHYEAGLRSYDRTMPEEINRIVTDSISDIYFTTSDDATSNLIKENISSNQIFMVGNLMIDTLISKLPKAIETKMEFQLYDNSKTIEINTNFKEKEYGVATFHRPNNVDSKEILKIIIEKLGKVSTLRPIIFPIHIRTLKNMEQWNLLQILKKYPNLYVIKPLGYLQFLNLTYKSQFVITDSGGIQEETTYLNIPCLTIRPNTERPITILKGSNKLIKIEDLPYEIELVMKNKGKRVKELPKFWDGKTANRIIQQLITNKNNKSAL